MMPVRKAARFVRDALTILLVTGLLLVAAEAVSRILFPDWLMNQSERTRIWRYDALLGWSMQPNQDIVHQYHHGNILIHTNTMGLRDSDYPLERNHKKRLLVLGDSFVWGWGVAAEKRFTELLEARHTDWEVINAGMSGYSTDQEYLYYTKRGQQFHPDAVLLLLYENDYEGNTRDFMYTYNKPLYRLSSDDTLLLENVPVPETSPAGKLARYISQECYLLSRLWQIGRFIVLTAQKALIPAGNAPSLDEQARQQQHITHRLIAQLDARLSSEGIPLLLLSADLQPGQLTALEQFTQDHDIPHLNLMPYLSGHIFRLRKDMHWNELGHSLVANAIEQHFFPGPINHDTTE